MEKFRNPDLENVKEIVGALTEDKEIGATTRETARKRDFANKIEIISERREQIHQGMNAEQYHKHLVNAGFNEYLPAFEAAVSIANAVKKHGGKALLVGGSVRDEIMGNVIKDYDLEIYGLQPAQIKEIASGIGQVDEVGEAFAVLKLRVGNVELDISLPRRESKTGAGHRDFSISADPNMGIKEAARRRDFTMNSLAKDILTGEIHDSFGGMIDIRKRILRVTDEERFKDDPLRVLRGMQFVGCFGLMVEDRTSSIMRELRDELKNLSKERLREEWLKLFLKSGKPSLGLNAAMEFGIFYALHNKAIMPMLSTQQEPEWHPEGDAWVHTMMVVDEAAKIVRQMNMPEDEAALVLLAAFCHDLGKPQTTKIIKNRITSHGHEEAGANPTENFLSAIGIEESKQAVIKKLVTEHLKPTLLYLENQKHGYVSDGTIRRLAERIHPATIEQLIYVAKADHLGRGPFVDPEEPEKSLLPLNYPAADWLLARAKELEISNRKPAPLLQGRDLKALGFKPGKQFGEIIRLADDLRDEQNLTRENILSLIADLKASKLEDVIAILTRRLSQ